MLKLRECSTADVVPLVLQDIAERGGSTRHPDTGAVPTTGYAVSLRPEDELRVPASDANLEAVFRHWLAGRTMGSDEYVGAWVDGADVVFDISTIVPGYWGAVALGRVAQQDAIYDIEHGKEIRL